MKRFLRSVEIALNAGDWYGALSTALTLPDMCGRIEAPGAETKARYIDWFSRYLLPHYTRSIGPDRRPHVFLHGEDCYALRCSYLHEGGGTITEHKARRALNSFHFVTPPGGGSIIHLNQHDAVLQLQVDIFCREMCAAVEHWLSDVGDDPVMTQRFGNLLEIHDWKQGVIF